MKILVRAPNWLGDAVMCAPFLKVLAETHAGAEIHVLCRPFLQEFFRGHPSVKNTRVLPAGQNPLGISKELRAENYDKAYVLPTSFSAAFLTALAGIPERIGYAAECRGFLLTEARRLDERYHYVRRYLGLLGEEGRDVSQEDLYFPQPGRQEDAAAAVFKQAGLAATQPLFAVAPGSQAPARRWFPERFADVINSLSEKQWPAVLLLGAPSDVPMAQAVAAQARRPVVNLCGKTNLIQLGDVLRRCSFILTNESGLMHVAWAVGAPTLVLAGASEPRLTSAFAAQIIQHREVPCVPCIRNECYRPAEEYKACMKAITTAEVNQAIKAINKTSVHYK